MSWKQREGSIVQLKKKAQRINHEINAVEVRLIGPENEQIGIVPIARALQMAEEAGLDLVETSAMAKPPVCKIVDYGKFRYQETKRAHQAKQKQKQIQIKEVKFRLTTDDNDYQTKLRNLMRFLEEGDKAKVSLRFRGREIARSDLGMKVLNRVSVDLKFCGVVEQFPKQEGKQIVMLIAPLKKA